MSVLLVAKVWFSFPGLHAIRDRDDRASTENVFGASPVKPMKQPSFDSDDLRVASVNYLSMQYATTAPLAKVAVLFPTAVALADKECHSRIVVDFEEGKDC